MDDDRQHFVFDVNEYERANQQWMCGGACEGTPCARGPNERGECGAVCQPEKIGDRYFCENAAQLSGRCDDGPCPDGSCAHRPALCSPLKKSGGFVCGLGACAEGPRPDGTCCQPIPPCRPRRRVLGRRSIATLLVLALAIGTGLLMVGGPARQQMISPGKLARSHSAMTGQCSKCHTAGDGTFNEWLHIALAGSEDPTLDGHCLDCHNGLRDNTHRPHTADPEMLAVLTQEANSRKTDGGPIMLRIAGIAHNQAISCSKCHREHQGAGHNLTAMSDTQCQSCHAGTFTSFSDGHPDFSGYPYTRRSRIYFDHVSHLEVHFRDSGRLPTGEAVEKFLVGKKLSQKTCVQCHITDKAGRKMVVRNFDQSCGACHAEQIKDQLSPGMLVLAIPGFDSSENDPNAWPPKHPEAGGTLSPILRLLLSTNLEFLELDRQVSSLDLSNLAGATEKQLAAAKKLPEVLKQQFKELASQGQPGIEKRLAGALNMQASDSQITQMAKLIPAGYLNLVGRRWLGGEDMEIAQPDLSGPYLRDRDRSLRYRPDRHADPILRAWIDASVRLGSGADKASPIHQVYRSLSHVAATGRCLKCHSIEESQDGSATVNWNPYRGQSLASFTTYSHRPHIVMLGGKSCIDCHVLDAVDQSANAWAMFRTEYIAAEGCARVGSSEFHSNFRPLQKSVCATCHKTGTDIQNCSTCHRYHAQSSVSLTVER